MLFNGDFSDFNTWGPDEKRESRFVFIGKKLDKEELLKGLESCKAEDPLRFKVGDAVQAASEEGWTKGKIIKVWDDGNPYRIELDDAEKTNVWGPIDDVRFVRAVA